MTTEKHVIYVDEHGRHRNARLVTTEPELVGPNIGKYMLVAIGGLRIGIIHAAKSEGPVRLHWHVPSRPS